MSPGLRCVRRIFVAVAMAVVATVTVALLSVAGVVDAVLALAGSVRRRGSDAGAGRPAGRWRLLRLGTFLVVYAVVDLTALVGALAVGVRAGRAGPRSRTARTAHYRLLRRALEVLVRVACPLFGVRVEVVAPGDTASVDAAPTNKTLTDSAQTADKTLTDSVLTDSVLTESGLTESGLTDSVLKDRTLTGVDGAGIVRTVGRGQAPALPPTDVPVLVLCRHAGPGDSFLLVHALLSWAALRPFVVLKDTLRLDPALDLILGRLPCCFVAHRSAGEDRDAIAALAASAGPGDAVVLFPEGGNFTQHRRARALRHLRRTARPRLVAEATHMERVLPPRTTGLLATLDAAGTADVVFVAHTGLDAVLHPRDVWRALPLDRPVRVTWWTVAAADIPAGKQAREDWLFAQWRRVDDWIARHAATAVEPSAAPGASLPQQPSHAQSLAKD